MPSLDAAARRRRARCPRRAPRTARRRRGRPDDLAHLLGRARQHHRARACGVLQQAVGLICPQLVRMRVACSGPQIRSNAATSLSAAATVTVMPRMIADHASGPLSSDHHPGQDVRRLQVDETRHDQDQHEAPADHLKELCAELGEKPRTVYAPIRVAITGSRVSPGLYESLELLGRETSLARLRRGAEVAARAHSTRRHSSSASTRTSRSAPRRRGRSAWGRRRPPSRRRSSPATRASSPVSSWRRSPGARRRRPATPARRSPACASPARKASSTASSPSARMPSTTCSSPPAFPGATTSFPSARPRRAWPSSPPTPTAMRSAPPCSSVGVVQRRVPRPPRREQRPRGRRHGARPTPRPQRGGKGRPASPDPRRRRPRALPEHAGVHAAAPALARPPARARPRHDACASPTWPGSAPLAPRGDVPAAAASPVCVDTLAALGFDLESEQGIRPDLQDRPQKSPRACVIASDPPRVVHLITRAQGGLHDYEAFLHEAGHALHYAGCDPALPLAFLRLARDHALTEIYSFLFDLDLGRAGLARRALRALRRGGA